MGLRNPFEQFDSVSGYLGYKMKTCRKCGYEKRSSEFHNDKRTKDGKYSYCISCRKEYDRLRYKPKDSQKRKQQKEYSFSRNVELTEYKVKKGCFHCGEKHPAVLDFHHKDRSLKDFNISAKKYSKSWKSLLKEIKKCIVLCSNCHRKLHYEERMSHECDG